MCTAACPSAWDQPSLFGAKWQHGWHDVPRHASSAAADSPRTSTTPSLLLQAAQPTVRRCSPRPCSLGPRSVPLSLGRRSPGARKLERCGIVFSVEPDRIVTTIAATRVTTIKQEILRMLAARGIVTRVQSLAGLLSWVAGIVPRLRPFVRPLWAAVAASGAPRAQRHGGSLPAGAAFTGQIRRALQWILRWLEVAATPLLTRQFPLLGREQPARCIIRTDASTTGMGAILFDARTLKPVKFLGGQHHGGGRAGVACGEERLRPHGALGAPHLGRLRARLGVASERGPCRSPCAS